MRQVYEKILIDIDPELNMLENFYMRLEQNLDNIGLRFIPNKRYPLTSKDFNKLNINSKYITNKPTSPWLCVAEVKDCVVNNIYNEKKDICHPMIFELFKRNQLLKTGGTNFIEYWDDNLEFFRKDVYFSLTEQEQTLFNLYVDSIVRSVLDYTNRFPNNVFDLDIETNHVFIENLGEIGAYRYFEYLYNRR